MESDRYDILKDYVLLPPKKEKRKKHPMGEYLGRCSMVSEHSKYLAVWEVVSGEKINAEVIFDEFEGAQFSFLAPVTDRNYPIGNSFLKKVTGVGNREKFVIENCVMNVSLYSLLKKNVEIKGDRLIRASRESDDLGEYKTVSVLYKNLLPWFYLQTEPIWIDSKTEEIKINTAIPRDRDPGSFWPKKLGFSAFSVSFLKKGVHTNSLLSKGCVIGRDGSGHAIPGYL